MMIRTLVMTLFAAGALAAPANDANTLDFAGQRYVHRWSKNTQHEYTPASDADLSRWRDMVTLDVHGSVHDGEALAALANGVLGNYRSHGKIVRTDSKPRTPRQPAEHFIAALLAGQGAVEAAFARVVLVDGTGMVVVYSHRAYGSNAGQEIGKWIEANGPSIEKTLMAWDAVPSPSLLERLPQSK